MPGPVTDTRLKILQFIVEHLEKNRSSPTREEIGFGIGLSGRSSVQYHVESLVENGFLERATYRHRMIRPTEKGISVIKRLKELDNG